MKEKRIYSRDEKIAYWTKKLEFAQQRLEHLKSDNYQEWNGKMQKDLDMRKLITEVVTEMKKQGAL